MSTTISGTSGMTAPVGAIYNGIQSSTAQASTSGTSIDFTNVPSWVKRITVMFAGVSTNGTSIVAAQIGTSSGIENTGYAGVTTTVNNAAASTGTASNGANYPLTATSATASLVGVITIQLLGSNLWVLAGNIGFAGATSASSCSGYKTLSGTLDRIRITTVNGTDTFDAGSINILYE